MTKEQLEEMKYRLANADKWAPCEGCGLSVETLRAAVEELEARDGGMARGQIDVLRQLVSGEPVDYVDSAPAYLSREAIDAITAALRICEVRDDHD